MTAHQFNAVLATIGWSRNVLAEKLGMGSDRAVRRWASGQNQIPQGIAAWLLLVARTLEDLPPPADWQGDDTHGGHAADTTPDTRGTEKVDKSLTLAAPRSRN